MIISGVKLDADRKKIQQFFRDELKVKEEEKVVEVWKFKNEQMTGVRFKNKDEKEKVMNKKEELIRRKSKIYLNDDLTEKEREIQKRLREKKARLGAKNPSSNIKVGIRKITIDGMKYKYNEEAAFLGMNEKIFQKCEERMEE